MTVPQPFSPWALSINDFICFVAISREQWCDNYRQTYRQVGGVSTNIIIITINIANLPGFFWPTHSGPDCESSWTKVKIRAGAKSNYCTWNWLFISWSIWHDFPFFSFIALISEGASLKVDFCSYDCQNACRHDHMKCFIR